MLVSVSFYLSVVTYPKGYAVNIYITLCLFAIESVNIKKYKKYNENMFYD